MTVSATASCQWLMTSRSKFLLFWIGEPQPLWFTFPDSWDHLIPTCIFRPAPAHKCAPLFCQRDLNTSLQLGVEGRKKNKSFTEPPIHPLMPPFSKHLRDRYHVPGSELSTTDTKIKSNHTWTMPSDCSPFSKGDKNINWITLEWMHALVSE